MMALYLCKWLCKLMFCEIVHNRNRTVFVQYVLYLLWLAIVTSIYKGCLNFNLNVKPKFEVWQWILTQFKCEVLHDIEAVV